MQEKDATAELVLWMNRTITSNSPPAISAWQTVLNAWAASDIDEVVNQFADEFRFTDHALGLEFKEKDRMHKFLVKSRDFFSDSERKDHTLLSDEETIVSEWQLTGTQDEPFLTGRFLKIRIRSQGVSVVRVKDGRIVEWSEYYDQIKCRRQRLGSWFADWPEI